MNASDAQRTTLVVTDVRDDDGTIWRAVHLTHHDELIVEGHDLGLGVERIFGCREYEFHRSLSADETAALRQLLGTPPDGDLLAAIERRFASTSDLECFLEENDLSGTFWSRIGD